MPDTEKEIEMLALLLNEEQTAFIGTVCKIIGDEASKRKDVRLVSRVLIPIVEQLLKFQNRHLPENEGKVIPFPLLAPGGMA